MSDLVPLAMTTPVVEMWAEATILMNRGATGRLALTKHNKAIDRADVVANADVVIPVLKFLGTRVTVDQIKEHVELFLAYSRPRGKPPLNSPSTAYAFFFQL